MIKLVIGFTLALTVLSAGAVFAASVSTSMDVSATVTNPASCTINAGPMNFGTYERNSASNVDSLATLTVNCTGGAPYTIDANRGLWAADGSMRDMDSGGTNKLPYNLFIDSGRTQVWGSTMTGGNTIGGTGMGSNQNVLIYGRIPSGADPGTTGSFTDTVTVSVNY